MISKRDALSIAIKCIRNKSINRGDDDYRYSIHQESETEQAKINYQQLQKLNEAILIISTMIEDMNWE